MPAARVELDGVTYDVQVDAPGGEGPWRVVVDGETFEVRLAPNGSGIQVQVGSTALHAERQGDAWRLGGRPVSLRVEAVRRGAAAGAGSGPRVLQLRPPMNGRVDRILVKSGDVVAKGQVLYVLEAMKMQNEVRSPVAGKVAAVHAAAGAAVEPSQVIVELSAD